MKRPESSRCERCVGVDYQQMCKTCKGVNAQRHELEKRLQVLAVGRLGKHSQTMLLHGRKLW